MTLPPEHEDLSFPFDDAGCFGCSARNPDGLGLRFRRDGDTMYGSYTVSDRFHGAPGIAHGGIVATILDEYSCAAAVFLRGDPVLTGELNVRYERPCPVEVPLDIRARIIGEDHPRYLVIEAEVCAGGEVLVRSSGKFFPRPAGRPTP